MIEVKRFGKRFACFGSIYADESGWMYNDGEAWWPVDRQTAAMLDEIVWLEECLVQNRIGVTMEKSDAPK